MDHRACYERLMEKAQIRVFEGYCERHHIVPWCIGGTNYKGNIVKLTPEEHYVAHQLLVKMFPGNESLLWAAMNMTARSPRHNEHRHNKLYGWLRKKLAERVSRRLKGVPKTAEHRAALSRAKMGRPVHRTPEGEARRVEAVRKGNVLRDKAFMRTSPYREQKSAEMREVWRRRKYGGQSTLSLFG